MKTSEGKEIYASEQMKKVIDYLCEHFKLTQKEIAEQIAKETGMHFEKYRINQLCNSNSIPENVIDALHKLYNINKRFLECKSEIMLDEVNVFDYTLEKIVSKWETIEEIYTNAKGENINAKILCVTGDSRIYNLLRNVNYEDYLKEHEKKEYSESFLENINNFLDKDLENMCEYLVIPKKTLFEIITSEVKDEIYFESLLSSLQKKE